MKQRICVSSTTSSILRWLSTIVGWSQSQLPPRRFSVCCMSAHGSSEKIPTKQLLNCSFSSDRRDFFSFWLFSVFSCWISVFQVWLVWTKTSVSLRFSSFLCIADKTGMEFVSQKQEKSTFNGLNLRVSFIYIRMHFLSCWAAPGWQEKNNLRFHPVHDMSWKYVCMNCKATQCSIAPF